MTTATAHDVLQYDTNPLHAIFAPKSVAIIGATERPNSVGRTIVWNLMSSTFGGTIYPVNPKRKSVLGIKAYPDIESIGEVIDLAIIVTPAQTVPAIVEACVNANVKGAIIISAGFKEIGEKGIALEKEILEKARAGNMRIIGPNCLGVMSPISGLNATFASRMARPGNLGFISQSGALCTSILDWSFRENVGFSAFVSIGSMLDIGWGDLIYYLGDDPRTKSIVIYMESIGDARSFLSAAREVALTKPIIVIKPGRSEAAAQAAASHTGSLTGSDEVLAAAFRRCGVLRVDSIDDLFNMAEVLAKQPRPRGPRLTIVTNAGGPGVLATDALITSGGELAPISDEAKTELDSFLPAHWSHANPIDILGDANAERYSKTLDVVANDTNSDGTLVILTPQAMSDPTTTAQQLKEMYARHTPMPRYGKPILASWMGGADVSTGEEILNQSNIPTFAFPDTAVRIFNYMWRYERRLRSLYETPVLPTVSDAFREKRAEISQIIAHARQQGRVILTEYESKQVMAAYDIPTVETRLAQTAVEATQHAETIGYPVVLKLNSETITHKTDVGGVQLNLHHADEVREAYETIQQNVSAKYTADDFLGVTVQPMLNLSEGYELIVGSSPDPQFGPVLLFGTGGTLVEVFKDRALGLPPLTTTLAKRMIEQTKIHEALQGIRGRKPIDMGELESLMVKFSQLVVEQRWVKEIDINPLLASAEQIIALDARVVLYDPEITMSQLPPPAIRPYPSQYIFAYTGKSGTSYTVRPIRPEDEPMVVQFHEGLSEESVYLRYFRSFHLDERVQHERLTRICHIDYDRTMALVAETIDSASGQPVIHAIGRLSKVHGQQQAEFALLVNDAYQGQGLGKQLLTRLLQIAKQEADIQLVMAYMLQENLGMKAICEQLGFNFTREENIIRAEINTA